MNIPYKRGGRSIEEGLDCWGIVIVFYERELGIRLPKLESMYYHDDLNHKQGASELEAEIERNSLKEMFMEVDESQPGDLLLFRILGHGIHVGIRAEDHDFLHAQRGKKSRIVNDYIWRNKIEQVYRHPANLG